MSKKIRERVLYHGLEWTVEGYYQKPQKEVLYKKNGDPGEPGFPSDIIDAEIWIECRQGPFTQESDEMQDILTEKAKEAIINLALEAIEDPSRGDLDMEVEIPW